MNLAIFGGEPAFKEPLHVGRPNLASKEELLSAVGKVIDSKWLTNDGPNVRHLEHVIEEFLQVDHCICVANGTLGLEIAAKALMPRLGEVIVPSFTFVATANALSWLGYTPVFADVSEETHTTFMEEVELRMTENTVGILGVHTWGTPCDIPAISRLAVECGIPLFFDAAHAFRCLNNGFYIGNFGDCEVFSFHATKFFNTIEGGAITTNDDELAEKCRRLRNFGFRGDKTSRTVEVGINAKMSEVHAAFGLANFMQMGEIVSTNWRNYQDYYALLDCWPLTVYKHYGGNYQYVVLEVRDGALSADDLKDILWAENVLARRYFSPPCHLQKPYEHVSLPVTETLADRVLVLPTGPAVSQEDVTIVCDIISYCIDHDEEIAERMCKNG